MAHARKYRTIENTFASRVISAAGKIFKSTGHFFVKLFHFFDEKLTIMVVPHSNGKVVNLKTNVFALSLGIVIFLAIVISFIPFSKKSTSSVAEISKLKDENRQIQASLDELRDENNNLLQTAKRFQTALNQSLSLLGISQNEYSSNPGTNSDLSSLFNSNEITAGTLKETSDIKQLEAYLASAIQPVEQVGNMLKSQETLFTDIPNIWPIKNGIGHISMAFGQNKHPIRGDWYIHKGMDISTYRSGDPVVSTANGQVVTVGFDPDGYGNYIIVKHKYGIYTRYAHLSTTRVQKGDQVSQHQIIGTIGNTGQSTGPHLHYEVHIGSDVVDPAKYISVK